MDEKKSPREKETGSDSGPGALCAEAQADGVPCTELGRDCEKCEKGEFVGFVYKDGVPTHSVFKMKDGSVIKCPITPNSVH